MSSHMRLKLLVAAVASFAAVSAQAAVQCPPSLEGHPLRSSGGGTLYEGPVVDNAVLAPTDTQTVSGGWVNIWHFVTTPDVTLVCRYAGAARPVSVPLTPDIRACRQDARSFVCR